MEQRYDVYGVGNAIVDLEMRVEDAALSSLGMVKGITKMVSPEEQQQVFSALGGRTEEPAAGGSAANTMVGLALFGGLAFFTGKVGNDPAGELYRRSMTEAGVEFDVTAAEGPTGTCLVLVTPDGQRTMRTSLGSSIALQSTDIRSDRIARSKMVYLEGYLWGAPSTASAGLHAMEEAQSAGVPVALSLSDPAMVQHFGDTLRRLTREMVGVVFCNEEEAKVYSGVDDRLDALRGVGRDCPLVFMTCGADGSIIHDRGEVAPVAGYQVPVVDTNGAGDVYAAGVLYGLNHGMAPDQAGKLGSFASARTVTHMGPRLPLSLAGHIPAILQGAHPLDLHPQPAASREAGE